MAGGCRLFCDISMTEFILWPGNMSSTTQGWGPWWMSSTVQAWGCSGYLLCGAFFKLQTISITYRLPKTKVQAPAAQSWPVQVHWLLEYNVFRRTPRIKVWCTKSTWQTVTRGIPCGTVVGPTLFNTFANDLTSVMQCFLSKFIYTTKLEGVLNG